MHPLFISNLPSVIIFSQAGCPMQPKKVLFSHFTSSITLLWKFIALNFCVKSRLSQKGFVKRKFNTVQLARSFARHEYGFALPIFIRSVAFMVCSTYENPASFIYFWHYEQDLSPHFSRRRYWRLHSPHYYLLDLCLRSSNVPSQHMHIFGCGHHPYTAIITPVFELHLQDLLTYLTTLVLKSSHLYSSSSVSIDISAHVSLASNAKDYPLPYALFRPWFHRPL